MVGPRRTRAIALIGSILLAVGIAPAGAVSAAPSAGLVRVTIRVLAPTKACSSKALSGGAAVPGVRVSVPGFQRDRSGVTDADGGVTLMLPAHQASRVTVTFDSPLLAIHPESSGRAPYQWVSQPVPVYGPDREVQVRMKDPYAAGLAALWRTAQLGRQFAARTTVKRLPKLDVVWEANASLDDRVFALSTAFDRDTKEVSIGGEGSLAQRAAMTAVRHEWEPFAVIHEIGHWFMDVNADPGDNLTSAQHYLESIYPKDHVLAYGEGFANAFASLALHTRRLDINCKRFLDFTPTLPYRMPYPMVKPLKDVQLSQYNEVWTGSIIRKVALWLASSDPQREEDLETADAVAGLGSLMKALAWYADAGFSGAPNRMRELADAVIRSGAYRKDARNPERATTNLAQLLGMFSDARMGLGLRVAAGFGPGDPAIPQDSPGGQSNYRVDFQIRGPDGLRCSYSLESPWSGFAGTPEEGDADVQAGPIRGLGGTWLDDCIATSEFAVIGYLTSAAPDLSPEPGDRWSGWARYVCTDTGSSSAEKCQGRLPLPLNVDRGAIDGFWCDNFIFCTSLRGDVASGRVSLSRGRWTKIVETDAIGSTCWLHGDLVAAQGSRYAWGCRS